MENVYIIVMVMCVVSMCAYPVSAHSENVFSLKEQSIVIISALAAKDDLAKLKPAFATGFEAGLTVNEIKEALDIFMLIAAFPAVYGD